MNKQFATTTSAAELLGVCPNTVRLLVKRGELKAYRVGSQLRFRVAELEMFLQSVIVGTPQQTQ